MAQGSNQLLRNLPQLQNLIKRDPESYEEEFLQQYRYLEASLQVFQEDPNEYNKSLEEIVMFMAQIAKCYPEKLATFPQILVDLLRRHPGLDPDMRMSFCRALILLRHKDLLSSLDLTKLFFDLLRSPDKALRQFLKDHIINDIKNSNIKRKDHKVNMGLQTFMIKIVQEGEKFMAKTALDVMIELYRKNIWKDAKIVNAIAEACLNNVTKIMVTAISFFLGKDENDDKGDGDSDDDDLPTVKTMAMANKVNKKSRKRQKLMENLKKAHKKKRKRDGKKEAFDFSALHLIHDPQGFAEKLFHKLDNLEKEKFEVKLLFLDLISRLIGTHELFLLNYYSYIARFMTPKQREVVQMLQFVAQAAHELVPADAMEPALRAIVNNFITERNAAEVIAVGLNAVRELCKRCPLAMDETLLRDLASYKTYKDKGVMMAARSLIVLYRTTCPDLLHKKDRGRTTEAMVENKLKGYGEFSAKDFVPGAEEVHSDNEEENDEAKDSDDEGWEDVHHSSDEDDHGEAGNTSQPLLSLEERQARARDIASTKIFSDADFKKIDAAQLKKQVQSYRRSSTKRGKKRKHEESVTEEGNEVSKGRDELVNLEDIEMVHKKRRHDKEARLASVMEGRKDREKYGSRKGKMNENASSTHKEKAKNKNFMMVKHKMKAKAKRSFAQKAKDLKKSMIRSRKFK